MKNCLPTFALALLTVATFAQGRPLELTARKEQPANAATQTVAIRAKDFTDLNGLQFSVTWPTTANLAFTSVGSFGLPDVTAANFNATQPGKLAFSWNDATGKGLALADDTVLFRISFTVSGPVPPGTLLTLTAAPTPTEATRLLRPISVIFGNENLSGCDCN